MAFNGKATYDAGATLPEIAEDVSDMVSLVSPATTPLLDAIGDPRLPAMNTIHEWIEDALLPNSDTLNDSGGISNSDTTATVSNGTRFRVGDTIQAQGSAEVILVTAISTNDLTITRGYGGTTAAAVADGTTIYILGNAALEGADADTARFTNRSRPKNYTQIFTETVEVSGTQQAVSLIGVDNEFEYQTALRLKEMLRYLERSVIGGYAPASTQVGSDTVRRTMDGIISFISTHSYTANSGTFASMGTDLTLDMFLLLIRQIYDSAEMELPTAVCNSFQKQRISQFPGVVMQERSDMGVGTVITQVNTDWGLVPVVQTRWIQPGQLLVIDRAKVNVLPLKGRSFQRKMLGRTGDAEKAELVGEYTTEVMNESAHALLAGLSTS